MIFTCTYAHNKLPLCRIAAVGWGMDYRSAYVGTIISYICVATPGPPLDVTLGVTSNTSLMVKFSEPEYNNGGIVTRYKSESCDASVWSSCQPIY